MSVIAPKFGGTEITQYRRAPASCSGFPVAGSERLCKSSMRDASIEGSRLCLCGFFSQGLREGFSHLNGIQPRQVKRFPKPQPICPKCAERGPLNIEGVVRADLLE